MSGASGPTVDDLLAALTEANAAQPEAAARQEAAAMGLAALPEALQPQALSALQDLLASGDADKRWWAVRALAALPRDEVIPLLIQALQDDEAPVRQCAALGLRQRPAPRAITRLVQALDDPDPLARRLAGEALAAIGGEAVPALLEVMAHGSQATRLGAVRALATIGDTRAIPALFRALDEDSALMEYWAGQGLEKMGVGMSFFIPG
jgi:HEAT repeat protein